MSLQPRSDRVFGSRGSRYKFIFSHVREVSCGGRGLERISKGYEQESILRVDGKFRKGISVATQFNSPIGPKGGIVVKLRFPEMFRLYKLSGRLGMLVM